MWVQSPASLGGLGIWRCRELWCRSKMRLGSRVAVAVVEAGSCISYSTPSPGTSICRGCSPNRKKKKKKKKTHKKAKNKAKQKGRAVLRQMYLNLRETNMHVTEAEKLVG